MLKFARWLFWVVVYAFRPTSTQSPEGYLTRCLRTIWPWAKFRPGAWHNDDGNQWHVTLTDEREFTQPRTITLDCHIGFESGDIVGFTIYDEILKRNNPGNAVLKELAKRAQDRKAAELNAAWDIHQEMQTRLFSVRQRYYENLQLCIKNRTGMAGTPAWPDAFGLLTPRDICEASLMTVRKVST